MIYKEISSCFAVLFMLLLWFPSVSECNSLVRCKKYYKTVIKEARHNIGVDAPAHYFMGQIEQESNCRADVTAFDGGMGLGQFMPATAEWMQKREAALQALGYNPYMPLWSIRALILYDKWLSDKTTCNGWYYTFRAYNGGITRLNEEIAIANSCKKDAVEKACKRKIIKLKSGQQLNMCNVNIQYPYQIFIRARKYEN